MSIHASQYRLLLNDGHSQSIYMETGPITDLNTLLISSRGATFVVAASDATARSQAHADYVCDGVNDEVQIQAAIDALPAAGGRVLLSEGTFLVNTAGNINTDSYVSYYAIKIMNTNAPITLQGVPGATIIKIVDGGAPNWPHVLLIRGSAASPRTNPTYVSGIEFDANSLATGGIGIQRSGPVVVDHCRFKGWYWGGIHSFHVSQKITITNNYFDGDGIIAGASALKLENNYFVITNNTFYDGDVAPTGVSVNLLPDYDCVDGLGTPYFNALSLVVENLFIGGNIQLWLSASQSVTVMGNVFSGQCTPGEYCMYINASSGVGQDARNNVVVGNTFYNFYNGIMMSGANPATGAIDNIVALNNFHEGPDRVVSIGITEGYGTTGNNLIVNNLFHSASTPINSYGVGSVVRGNIGWVTENQGAAASIADGGTIDHGCAAAPTVATVSGSVAGDIVTVTSLDATHITVAIKKHDGTAGTTQTVYWRAQV